MSLASDYAKLYEFLESQSKNLKPKKVEDHTTSKEEDPQEKTKRILEECQEIKNFSDIPQFNNVQSSKGFDVFKFESLMRAKLIDGHKRIQSYERPYISVTELCQCLRKSYYSRLKYPVDLNKQYSFAYLSLINHVGDSVHEFVQSLYDFTETEKTIVSETYKVKGRIDGLREGYLLELKTIDKDKFKNKYLSDHYNQGLIYSYILNNEYNYNIHTITIVYFLRNFKRVIPFDLPIDNDKAKIFLDNALGLRSCINRKSPPDPIGANEEQCNFCLYKNFCEKDDSKIDKPFTKKKNSKSVFLL